MNRLLHFILRPDWCFDHEGAPTLRLWGILGITFYKWHDVAIFQNARDFAPVSYRGIVAKAGA